MKTYTTTHVKKALDIPRERLKDWMMHGFISPSIPAQGHGKPAGFTIHDLRAIALFQFLIDEGFVRKTAAQIVANFLQDDIDPGTSAGPPDYLILRTFRNNDGATGVQSETYCPVKDDNYWAIRLDSGVMFTINEDLPEFSVKVSNALEHHRTHKKNWLKMIVINLGTIRAEVDEKVKLIS
jgi:hypothetical protein